MSEPSEQEQIISQDPLNYAPRWLREKPEPRMAVAEPRVEREAKPEAAVRPPARTNALDRQLENAVYESLRRSLDPEVMPEPPLFLNVPVLMKAGAPPARVNEPSNCAFHSPALAMMAVL